MTKYDTTHLVFLRMNMRRSGLTNKYFAHKLKIQESNLSAYLSGDKMMPLRIQDGIRDILKVWQKTNTIIDKKIGEKDNE